MRCLLRKRFGSFFQVAGTSDRKSMAVLTLSPCDQTLALQVANQPYRLDGSLGRFRLTSALISKSSGHACGREPIAAALD
jgi:hypothetical protein